MKSRQQKTWGVWDAAAPPISAGGVFDRSVLWSQDMEEITFPRLMGITFPKGLKESVVMDIGLKEVVSSIS